MSASQNALRQTGSEPAAAHEPPSRYDYIRDGGAIYARSFAMIRAEADLARWSGAAERVVVRMIHACGMTDLPADVDMSPGFAEAGVAALQGGAPILCDVRMVADGVTRARLPAANPVICTLGDPRVPDLAKQLDTTRSAAAMELWREHLPGSVVAVGNAPTALFRLLELLDAGVKPPAAVIGIPVGLGAGAGGATSTSGADVRRVEREAARDTSVRTSSGSMPSSPASSRA